MRYYKIIIFGLPSDIFPTTPDGATWSSWVNGQNDPGAQQIEFNIEEWRPTVVSADSTLTIHGVSWKQIGWQANLVGKTILVYGGMSPTLPLAQFQSRVAGLLLEGKIKTCWGNWIGTDMSIGMSFVPSGVYDQSGGGGGGGGGGDSAGGGSALDAGKSAAASSSSAQLVRYSKIGPRSINRRLFSRDPNAVEIGPIIQPFDAASGSSTDFPSESVIGQASSTLNGVTTLLFGGGASGTDPLQAPLNLIHNLMPNMPLSSAIQETLSRAFPQANINMLINNALKLPYQDAGMYQSAEQYAQYINNLSNSILGTNKYPGVQMSAFSSTINVWDGTNPVTTGVIAYADLIGQPTWVNIMQVHAKTVLRSDLRVGSFVTLPNTIMGLQQDSNVPLNTGQAAPQRTNLSFPGNFVVTRILHIGDFRNPDGSSWCTNFELTPQSEMTSDQLATLNANTSAPATFAERFGNWFFPNPLYNPTPANPTPPSSTPPSSTPQSIPPSISLKRATRLF